MGGRKRNLHHGCYLSLQHEVVNTGCVFGLEVVVLAHFANVSHAALSGNGPCVMTTEAP